MEDTAAAAATAAATAEAASTVAAATAVGPLGRWACSAR